jgi:hypothetical protein
MRKWVSFALEVDGVGPTVVADMRDTVNVFNVCPDFLRSDEKRREDASHSESTFVRNPQRQSIFAQALECAPFFASLCR